MTKYIFCLGSRGPVLRSAGEALKARGYGVVEAPCAGVTHLLLPVPTPPEWQLPEGLSPDVTLVGGNLDRFTGCRRMDLLKDEMYLARNAAITAYCALSLAMAELPVVLRGCRVLIIGWGRIAKCLAALCWALEADVTVAARKESDRAMACALGYRAENTKALDASLNDYRLIFNTAPETVLTEAQLEHCRPGCLKMDLASRPGLEGKHILWARGLPGKCAPESSGALIAKTVIRLLQGKEQL